MKKGEGARYDSGGMGGMGGIVIGGQSPTDYGGGEIMRDRGKERNYEMVM